MAVVAALCAVPAIAQQRDLPVPADKGWGHAATGVTFPARLAGLPRTSIRDSTADERDVSLNFETPDRATVVTIFLFHPALAKAAIWFDRSEAQIALRTDWHGATPADPNPTAFARPGSAVSAGLKQAYRTGSKEYPTTALAVVPVGEWLVAVRYSARDVDIPAVRQRLDGVIDAIRWPAETGVPPPAARPIAACADTLRFGKAKMMKRNINMGLMGGLLSGLMVKPATDAKPEAPRELCRNGAPTLEYGVYRAAGSDGYTIAFGDAGRVAYVAKGIEIPGMNGSGGYTVTFGSVDGAMATYQSFDRLPSPKQVMDEINSTAPVSRTNVDAEGKTQIHIDAPK